MSPGTVQRLGAGLLAIDALDTEAVCCFLTEDERPLSGAAGLLDWRLCGALSRVLKAGFFTGAPGEKLLLPAQGQVPVPKLFAVGLGPLSGVTALGFEHALAQAAEMLAKAQVGSVALTFPALPAAVEATREELATRAFTGRFPGRVGVLAG